MGRIDTNECWLVGLRICDWKPAVEEGILEAILYSLAKSKKKQNKDTGECVVLHLTSCHEHKSNMQKEVDGVWWQVKRSIEVYTNRCLRQRRKHKAACSLGYRTGNAPVGKLSSASFGKRKGKRSIHHRDVLELLDVIKLIGVKLFSGVL